MTMRFGDVIIRVITSGPKRVYKQVTCRLLVCEPFGRGEIPGYFCLIITFGHSNSATSAAVIRKHFRMSN